MFLRRHRKVSGGETYEYWSLVKTVRTARGPRHQLVAHLGKLDGAEQRAARSWQDLDALLSGDPAPVQLELGRPAVAAAPPLWRSVDVRGVRVERVRQFGLVYLGLALWRRLRLHEVLRGLLPAGQEEVGWDLIACVLTLARFYAQKSELSVAERWYADTPLEDLLGMPLEKINDARLYRGLDELLAQKEPLCRHLLEQYRSWFGVRFEFLLYPALSFNCDFPASFQNGRKGWVTSTYFEGLAESNAKAARGYSRDHRPDYKQVCI